jgi:hypothetical protein
MDTEGEFKAMDDEAREVRPRGIHPSTSMLNLRRFGVVHLPIHPTKIARTEP